MNKTFNRNLVIGFGLSLVLLVISAFCSYYSIVNLLKSADLVEHSGLVMQRLEDIVSTMKDSETGQRGYLLTGKKDFLEPYNGAYARSLNYAEQFKELTEDNPQQQANAEKIIDILEHRLNIQAQMVQKKDEGLSFSLEDMREGKSAMDALRRAVKKAESDEKSLLEERTGRLKRFAGLTPAIIIFASILAIGFSAFSLLKVLSDMRERNRLLQALEEKDREISRRISIIQRIAEKISEGDYLIRVDDHEQDDLGVLSASLNKMASSLQFAFGKLADNDWLQAGANRLNDLMIGEKDLSALSQDILYFLAEYTRSEAGALYLLENDVLTLQSGFALSDPKKTIKLGEGMLGQAAIINRSFWLKELGQDQIQVSYATGESSSRNVLIIPLQHQKEVKGVIELGSVNAYPERKLTFLNAVSGNIGIALQSAQNRQRLQELLEETQAQAEELQVQHNELEGMNAELEAHTQKLQTSEEELRVQQEELQQTNQELAEKNIQVQQRTNELQEKARQLELSTRYKSEFMANMSHELRTPLNSILLLSRFLSENTDQNLNAEQIESANVILSSGRGLLDLIDELLDLSKIEAGKMDLEYYSISVGAVIENLKPLFAPVANDKQLDLEFENLLADDFKIETDQMRLEQILKNLLSNALKFTASGKVKLTIRQNQKNKDYLDWEVSDSGIGIAPDKQQMVFDAFQQADGSTKRRFGGTGLGLSISRQLARLLGGDISLSSEPGKGSKFVLSVPVNKPESLPQPQASAPAVAPATDLATEGRFVLTDIPEAVGDDRQSIGENDKVILIIEDDTVFAKALIGFARKNGYKAIASVRGDEGLALARQFRPLAVLLDIQLPVMDGWQVMDALKGDAQTRHIPVHIMSSAEVKKESRSKGAVDFINKPVAIEQMNEIFKKLEAVWSKFPKKVLIVEENIKHAEALAYFLDAFNVSTAVSKSVEDSLDALKYKQVDCVIMDMAVPGKYGYESLDAIKQHPGMEDLPIIVFTGKHLSPGEEGRIRRYADTIVVKTAHSYQRILDEIKLFLHLVEGKHPSGVARLAGFSEPLKDILAGKTILIADDDVRNIFSMTRALEQYGMTVLSATDGREALEILNQHPETAIVLMDIMMPEMDGYESTMRIRQDARFSNLPIIAVTAKAMLGDREKCIQAGASDYISKPVDIDQLASLLRVWLFNQ